MVESKSSTDQKINILLAEDNPVNQEVIFEMLSSLCCRVEVVSDGKQAIEAAVSKNFDLILMDCQMPVMDGHDSTRRIRLYEQQKGSGRIPIVGITGRAVQGNYDKCKAAGMDDYLDKPFTIEKLKETVCHWTKTSFSYPIEQHIEEKSFSESSTSEVPCNELFDCLDKAAIRNICIFKKDPGKILEKLVGIYLRDAPIKFLEIRKGIYEKNPELVFQASHSLKSSSANVGATALVSMSHELEINSRSRMIDGAQTQLEKMESEYIKVAEVLKSMVENPHNLDKVIASIIGTGDRDD
ncbi:MAG: response regulator [Desulfobacterales bacterium]